MAGVCRWHVGAKKSCRLLQEFSSLRREGTKIPHIDNEAVFWVVIFVIPEKKSSVA